MWIRLNGPEAMNSLTPQVLKGLNAALDEAEREADVVSVVLIRAGRAFCGRCELKYVRTPAAEGSTGSVCPGVLRGFATM